MATLDLDIAVMFAALHPDGSVLLEIAVSDSDLLTKVTIPSSTYARQLAREVVIPLDLDDLPSVAPQLAGEIDWFVAELRDRLITQR